MAESFGSDPERYDRARPRYPEAMIEHIVRSSPGPTFLDVGTGTGIVARQFRDAGCRVLGVDVDERMADLARRDGFEVEVSPFESWDRSGRKFDAVVAGQAWHWVDPVAGAAKAADSLYTGGMLAVFWNAGQPPEELSEAFSDVYRRVMPDSISARGSSMNAVDGYSMLCSKASDGMKETGAFGEAELLRFDWERTYSRSEWLDVLPTQGDHSQFPKEQLEELLGGIGDVIDAVGGAFPMSYTALLTTAKRVS